ncbi:aminotransferase class III-fold pyridoxal phosphate-dependent enzyme [Gimibacter soli]|uniref:Aminotransferase class III-fold pyridoxal phosphate-dependent enzyme n=1 Tax=Gimibacter soli TaxID=3024400 RepID=A0AAF0BHL6_9PROT|nr:aminotransferase class III-fold pyridoxal phosphate-dependent enzyme [Gimibacter soli]WCL54388.1 aminotransferase class III-fold pyridoxal phosphate-dependent enzyme [Gimibacter soli]
MSTFRTSPPALTGDEILALAEHLYGLQGRQSPLVSERDQNALIDADGARYVLKIANRAERTEFLAFQNAALTHVATAAPGLGVPRLIADRSGNAIATHMALGEPHAVRLLTYLEGKLFSEVPKTPALFAGLGRYMGGLSKALKSFGHAEAHRSDFLWNLDNVAALKPYVADIVDPATRARAAAAFAHYRQHVLPRLGELRAAVIHNDLNDNNIVVAADGETIAGAIDYGDMVFARQINELATALAYALFDVADVPATASTIITAYAEVFPLEPAEADLLFDLVTMRLVMSLCISSHRAKDFPDNDYLLISQAPAMELLAKLEAMDRGALVALARRAAGFSPYGDIVTTPENPQSIEDMIAERGRLLGPSLSLSYRKKLKIVKGRGAWLYDQTGRAFLDCVNNISHVGHCHPHVVQALSKQAAVLNTNTRYLNDNIQRYAERLLATFPDPLSVVYFVCSGSEANELALRLARTATGRRGTVVVDWAYHGNTSSLIEISPYKFNRKGGKGRPDHVRIAALPDPYRGPYKGYGPETGKLYAAGVEACIADLKAASGEGPAAFIAESIAGVAGQVVYPEGYLKGAYAATRATGGLCIADEVQTGFGRVGTHMWAFEQQGVVPDIVTLGKPIGNGHPMAAVVTTRAIADAFANGMEYFNSFGGNPVSCAVGMAVMDVIEREGLQAHALETGRHLLAGLEGLRKHPLVGDVRGTGLFVGIELVEDHETLTPATAAADRVVQFAREAGVLLSTDGPFENIIKIKPPMAFGKAEADLLVATLDAALQAES